MGRTTAVLGFVLRPASRDAVADAVVWREPTEGNYLMSMTFDDYSDFPLEYECPECEAPHPDKKSVDTCCIQAGLGKTLPFPWQCPRCLQREVRPETVEYATRGVTIPEIVIPKCGVCGELVLCNDTCDRIRQALRRPAESQAEKNPLEEAT